MRDYTDNGPVLTSSLPPHVAPSPMRIGDSFEDMKRKMIPRNDPRKTHTPTSTAVVIRSNSPSRTFSPDTSLDRLVACPMEFQNRGESTAMVTMLAVDETGAEGTETRPVQTSARRQEEEEADEEPIDGEGEAEKGTNSALNETSADVTVNTSSSGSGSSGPQLRGIALSSASAVMSRTGSCNFDETFEGCDGADIRTFAAQFVSNMFGSNGMSFLPPSGRVTPLSS